MKDYIIILVFSFLSISTSVSQNIDSKSSVVDFKIGNFGLNNVKGTFNDMSGNFNFNVNNIDTSNFDICIKSSTINTNNDKRDKHLKSEDFFNVEKHPTICYKSNSVSKIENAYITKGKLTLHGVTKEVEITFQFNDKTFKGYLEINRLDYGVGSDTGTFMVADKVKINITCVLQ